MDFVTLLAFVVIVGGVAYLNRARIQKWIDKKWPSDPA